MDLTTLAKEMRATALQHPFTPSLENILSHPDTERDVDVEGVPLHVVFTRNVFKKELHGFNGETWHLSISDRRRRTINKLLLERILRVFFDQGRPVDNEPVPGQHHIQHFSQILSASL